ncbi:sigma-70 family RNA polymerase sigma factor [Pseudoroseomonas cervicalis]
MCLVGPAHVGTKACVPVPGARITGHELAALRRPASRAQQRAGLAGLSDAFQRYIDARQEIVEGNLKRVVWLARRYARAAVPFLDLVQEGQIGLLRAIDRFDPDRGFRFGTYATWWIRQSMSRYVQDQGRTVRVPVHMLERIAKAKRASEALRAKTGGADATGARGCVGGRRCVSRTRPGRGSRGHLV